MPSSEHGINPRGDMMREHDMKFTQQDNDQIIVADSTQNAGVEGVATENHTAFLVKSLEDMISSNKLPEALDFIEALSQEERQNWQIQNLTGIVCSCCSQYSEALTFFIAALEQRPDDPEVLYNLADTYVSLGMGRQAKAMLDRCRPQTDDEELADDIAALRQTLGEMKGGRVLMAAYYFPPLSGSGVFRSIKFAKYLPQFGWQPTVLSTDRPPNGWNFADESMVGEIPEGMEVVRLPDGISTGRETTLSGDRVQAILNFLQNVLKYSPEAESIFSRVARSKDGVMRLLTFPCSALSWAYDMVQYIEKKLDLRRFDIVYTTSGPSSAHLIGFYLKQKYGIPWVADYRDPWTFNPYGAEYNPADPGQRLLFELESVLLHCADCNLTIEESLTGSYVHSFGLTGTQVKSITNGYDEADFAALPVPQDRMDKFTINYSGLLYTRQRSITPILAALQQLKDEKKIELAKLRFRIVGVAEQGNLETVQRFDLAQIIDHTGYLSHAQALQANLNANLLLLLVGDEEKFKPVYTGKFFEYLRSGRPILAIAPKDGAVDRVLRESGHGEAFLSTQISEIKAMILREYRKWETGQVGALLYSPVIERFERKALAQQLSDVLSAAVDNQNSLPVSGSEEPISRLFTQHSPRIPLLSFQPSQSHVDVNSLAELFLKQNYNYVWLKAMLHYAAQITSSSATLITGSSYGVNGIIEHLWTQAVNCSVSSQDLYYDFLCARKAISSAPKGRFTKCFIVDGYYAACHDLSRGERERELMIPNVYYPTFKDGHNWTSSYQNDLWSGLGNISAEDKYYCEKIAIEIVMKQGTYFSMQKQRGGTVFDLKNQNWWDLSSEQRQMLGKSRAECHNKLFRNQGSITDNKNVLGEYVHFLHLNGVTPIFVVAPFAAEYSRNVLKEMKMSVLEMISCIPEEIYFVDFNQFTCFESADFVDTDHLSKSGAEKFSKLLIEMFGK